MTDEDELKQNVTIRLNRQAIDFFDNGINKLVPCLNKCLDLNSDYTEK